MDNTARSTRIPYPVLRSIRAYKQELRAAITQAVRERLASGDQINPEDIGYFASDLIFGEIRHKKAMEESSIKAYHAGDFRFLKDVLKELHVPDRAS